MIAERLKHHVERALDLLSGHQVRPPSEIAAAPFLHAFVRREPGFALPDLRDGHAEQFVLDEAWKRDGCLAEDSEGVANRRVGVDGEDVAVEHRRLADYGIRIEFCGEERHGHLVACAVDNGVDVGEDSAVGELDGFGTGDAFDLGAGFDEAVFEERVDLVGDEGRCN